MVATSPSVFPFFYIDSVASLVVTYSKSGIHQKQSQSALRLALPSLDLLVQLLGPTYARFHDWLVTNTETQKHRNTDVCVVLWCNGAFPREPLEWLATATFARQIYKGAQFVPYLLLCFIESRLISPSSLPRPPSSPLPLKRPCLVY